MFLWRCRIILGNTDMKSLAAAIALAIGAAPATAAELRPLCADRPGLETPACTVDAGHVQFEVGLGDWVHDSQPDVRTDTILAGDVLARIGLSETTEARIGWTAYGHQRERDRATGVIDRTARTGDVTIGVKQNLRNPDGSGLSIALLPYAVLPVGGNPIGAGAWGTGLTGAITYELTDALQIVASPEIAAAADEDRRGHLQYGGEFGASAQLTNAITATVDVEWLRDHDPEEHETEALAGLSIAWQPRPMLQFDLGSNIGLDHTSPDVELYFGVTRKF
jgi:hypothetical protein